jgi:predicted AlkP superfamily pyrophosphatase or phosphodiesterase
MKYFATVLILTALQLNFFKTVLAQPAQNTNNLPRPKLVVGIVIDQMRWDYLYRYYNIYKADGGFKRFLSEGFTCENTFIPYTPTVTAAGHTCIYTGSVPAINGIIGNTWYDRQQNKEVYCAEDDTAKTVGSNTVGEGQMSPRNMLTTTITDELRLATNFKGKVIGIALKDRGAILPAGHSANAAYWYDIQTGNFVTSTYYMNELPAWVQNFNNRKIVDSLYKLNWNLSLPKEVYSNYCSADNEPYENKPFGADQLSFPYNLSKFAEHNYSVIAATPYGNTVTLELAKAALLAEGLGKSGVTDFLAISISSPDYIGHTFGPNSWEQLDDYARLDYELGKFFSFLDAAIGKGQYTVFLSADHGVVQVPGYLKEHKLPAGLFNNLNAITEINQQLKQNFGADSLIITMDNYQLYLNHSVLKEKNIDEEKVKSWVIDYLLKNDAIYNAFDIARLSSTTLNEKQKSMCSNGYNQRLSGDIQVILKPNYIEGGAAGTTHGLWNPYDSHIPLLFYGWGIKHDKINRETYMTDIAPTLAALLHIQMPSGCVGKVIEEVINPPTP